MTSPRPSPLTSPAPGDRGAALIICVDALEPKAVGAVEVSEIEAGLEL